MIVPYFKIEKNDPQKEYIPFNTFLNTIRIDNDENEFVQIFLRDEDGIIQDKIFPKSSHYYSKSFETFGLITIKCKNGYRNFPISKNSNLFLIKKTVDGDFQVTNFFFTNKFKY